jgi:hypothetical protein
VEKKLAFILYKLNKLTLLLRQDCLSIYQPLRIHFSFYYVKVAKAEPIIAEYIN